MASGFDPYYKWLGIPPEEQPPTHYRLLGLRQFESDPEVIEAASDQRMAHLRTYQAGQYSALSQKLLNEVAGAKLCLLSPEKRDRYDETLRAGGAPGHPLAGPGSRVGEQRTSPPAAAPVVPLQSAAAPNSPSGLRVDMPVAPFAPLQSPAPPPPLPESPTEPPTMGTRCPPPTAGDHGFDLERLGVSEDMSGGSAVRTSSGIGRRSHGSARGDVAAADLTAEGKFRRKAKSVRTSLIAALAALAILLVLITTVVYLAKGKRTADAAAEGRPSSADPMVAVDAADTARAQNRAADEDLQALQKHAPELLIAGPLSPLRGTRLGPWLWLHMNFQRDTVVEHEGSLFVKDLSGLNHHGICRRGRPVPGRAGDALQCETPLRLLEAAVNQVPQFTLLAWVRCPSTMGPATAAWWFDEDSQGKSLLGVGCGNHLQLRAFSKSKQKTCNPISLTKLPTPPEQWNFIALRSEVRDGDTFLMLQVNDQKFPFNNPDLFPVQVADVDHDHGNMVPGRACFANTPKVQLAELMIFRTAISDADIQALRSNANPWSVPAGMDQLAVAPPRLVDPADGATVPNPDPPTGIVLRWQGVADASRYWARVEVPNNPKPLVDAQNLDRTSLRMTLRHPVPRENCRGWHWQVRAMVNGQWTAWSETHTFDLAEPARQAAPAHAPEENPQVQSQPVEPEKSAEPEKPVLVVPPSGGIPPKGGTTSASDENPFRPQPPIVRQPLPPAEARKQANLRFHDVYKKQYDATKTPEDRLALAEDMLHKADELADDPAARYVLLDRARALSANAGDAGKALEIVERMGRYFQIDVLPVKIETLTDGMQPGVPSMARDHDIGESVLEVMEQLGQAKQYEAAIQLGSLYRDRSHRPANAALLRRVVAQIKAMRDAQQGSVKDGESRGIQ